MKTDPSGVATSSENSAMTFDGDTPMLGRRFISACWPREIEPPFPDPVPIELQLPDGFR